ncbi:ornithine cyclodeaminase family protein [Streptomyces pathocidini]|uniref:ornithine cyclodeaminase family protein n=1 Tax=Streptomyces pathocidini TaxID=1650571 RepID=UPI0033DB83D5
MTGGDAGEGGAGGGLRVIGAAEVDAAVPMAAAIAALQSALRGGLDPETDPARSVVPVEHGQLLLMPAQSSRYAGVKVASVAPANPALGRPRIQGNYLLLDARTLTPLALLDGVALTSIRTAAVSAAAADLLAAPDAERLVLFGTGPQAHSHLAALRAVRPVRHVTVVGRDRGRVEAFVGAYGSAGRRGGVRGGGAELGLGGAELGFSDIELGAGEGWLGVRGGELEHGGGELRFEADGLMVEACAPGQAAVEEAIRAADLVACCTTARTPLFDGSALPAHATVTAVGSHEPDAREVDDATVRRSTVVVEARAAALREAGDVIQPLRAGLLEVDDLVGMADVVRGKAVADPARPRLFKSVGMAWEDLVVAGAAYEAVAGSGEREGDRDGGR